MERRSLARILSFMVCVVFICLSSLSVASGEIEVSIDKTNFPDDVFRKYVEQFDKDGNKALSHAELDEVWKINVNQKGIKTLKGIEFFDELECLLCANNQLTSLDVSQNEWLLQLECQSNQLTSIDLKKNTNLQVLDIRYNQLTSINLSQNPDLISFRCDGNKLTSLDVSRNRELKALDCCLNKLGSLELSNNTELVELYCIDDQLSYIDVRNCPDLEIFYCYTNQLTSLDVSRNTKLHQLVCDENKLTSLDLSKNKELKTLNSGHNPLGTLDVSNNTALVELYCAENQLTSLDVSKNTELVELGAEKNALTTLDVSANKKLTELYCEENKLKTLDVSNNPNLVRFFCYNNGMTELKLGSHPKLEALLGEGNKFTSLDVSKCPIFVQLLKDVEPFQPGSYRSWDVVVNDYLQQCLRVDKIVQLTPDPDEVINEKITAYVTRCYDIIMGRKPDDGGLRTWYNELKSGRKAAAEIIDCFVCSAEFQNKKLSNADTVEILYKAMLGRGSDAAGKASWVSQLENGTPIQAVINGFCGSAEFGSICKAYGIKPGSVTVPEGQQREASDEKIQAYVSRCYEIILGRKPDEGGMKTWFNELVSGRKAAAEIIDSFVNSTEFQNKKLSNPDKVEILYKAMLGRGSDAVGKSSWVSQLENGKPLATVINGFCGSAEFKGICESYGINPGSVTVTEGQEQQAGASDEKIKAFVIRCYKIILGRDADEGGLNTWSNELKSGRKAAAEIIEAFVNSQEFQNKRYSNPDAVEILYKAMLGRGSDAAGKSSWVAQLNNGQPLTAIINGFCGSAEFKTLCDSYGITPGTVKVETTNAQAEESLSGLTGKATVTKKTENQNVTKVEIVNASDTVNENLGTAVQAIYINEEKAKEFIGRCYRSILGREASEAELDSWIGQMMNGSKTADQIARGFLFSGEFKGKSVSNEELVKILYRVYMNREADTEGLATWTQKLDEGTSLQDLLNTFSRTNEFKAVLKKMAE